jgi:hypothetical protein
VKYARSCVRGFGLLIWATAEGFGGPYGTGATGIGTAITDAVVFALLYLVDDVAGRSPLAVDTWIERRALGGIGSPEPRPVRPRVAWSPSEAGAGSGAGVRK